MNTRIQVEHPVTEVTTGVDLVAEQLRIAAGEPLAARRRTTSRRVAARSSCASTPRIPAPASCPARGRSSGVVLPAGPWVRMDTWMETGGEVPPFYDSLLGKLIVWGDDRATALARARRALPSSTWRACRPPRRCSPSCSTRSGSRRASSTRPRSRRGSKPIETGEHTEDEHRRRHERSLQLGRRRAPVRRDGGGDEPRGVLPRDRRREGAARAAAGRGARHLPRQRLLPGAVRPRPARARSASRRSRARSRPRSATRTTFSSRRGSSRSRCSTTTRGRTRR